MSAPWEEVGAFDAKTRLSELLRETERGRSFLILRRGRPVARLLPPAAEEGDDRDPAAALEALRRFRARHPGRSDVAALVREGRDR